MADIKWLEITVNTTPDQLDQVSAKLTAAGMAGAEPAILGLCGPGAAGPDEGSHPDQILCHG